MWLLTLVQDIPWPYLEGKRVPGSKPFPVAGQTEFVLHRHRRTLFSSQCTVSLKCSSASLITRMLLSPFLCKSYWTVTKSVAGTVRFWQIASFREYCNGLNNKCQCNKDSRGDPLGFLVLKCMPLFHSHTHTCNIQLLLALISRRPTCPQSSHMRCVTGGVWKRNRGREISQWLAHRWNTWPTTCSHIAEQLFSALFQHFLLQ